MKKTKWKRVVAAGGDSYEPWDGISGSGYSGRGS